MKLICNLFLVIILLSNSLLASETIIQNVTVSKNSANKYSFSVTLLHNDDGWDHYANSWQVELVDGTFVEKRTLFHPHVNEQPFTRSLSGVSLPKGTKQVVILAGCTVDGLNSHKYLVELP